MLDIYNDAYPPAYLFARLLFKAYQQFKYTAQDPLIVWSFNGNKFDMVYLLKDLTTFFGKVDTWGSLS